MSKKDEILNAVAEMSVMELVELIDAIEEKFGVTAAMPVAAAPAVAADEAVAEQTEFNLLLTSFGEKKVQVIKVVRALTGLGLREGKELVEGAPATIKEGLSKGEAEEGLKQLQEAGAVAELA